LDLFASGKVEAERIFLTEKGKTELSRVYVQLK